MKRIKFFLLSTMLLLVIGSVSAHAVVVYPDDPSVTENWVNDYTVEFTMTTGSEQLIAFAVGNNYSLFGASINNSLSDTWNAAAIVNHQELGWQILEFVDGVVFPSEMPELIPDAFLNQLTNNGYSSAFLYYSADNGTTVLDRDNSYNGFEGMVYGLDSTFVTLDTNRVISTGNTSIVPLPSASLLLLAGLAGLIGIKRNKLI
ncbi:MAG: hypothetical protein CSA29_02465 [Desulfobacterales bacterium]|nr:MAG: hypothetical protein CSA29_02465 [Desulfobacterales bacterium]